MLIQDNMNKTDRKCYRLQFSLFGESQRLFSLTPKHKKHELNETKLHKNAVSCKPTPKCEMAPHIPKPSVPEDLPVM